MEQNATQTLPRPGNQTNVKQPRLWNVVLLDDEEHSYEYVIEMAQALFGHPRERAYQVAKTVDAEGRAILMTTHRELGELKVEQVHSFGQDRLIATCKGSMSALLEPAELDADDQD
ncbi:MAG: ATP-dependent Clp protease adaptor ClpS [Phycisphaerae bacterium]|nr:ATP-dependent Clp protease adaptor ClpS [Phycisphaerae bacterium]